MREAKEIRIDADLAEDFGLISDVVLPERQLWLEVLLLAIGDAIGKNSVGSKDIYRLQLDTQNWFYYAGHDFKKVCEYAGLEADRVQYAVLDYLTRPSAA